MKLILDMNLSPEWVEVLASRGHEALHWSQVGDPGAEDTEILEWARANDYIVFTNDLDFGRLLALTYARGPSVLQIRGTDLLQENVGEVVLATLEECSQVLEEGAILMVDRGAFRVRILPIRD